MDSTLVTEANMLRFIARWFWVLYLAVFTLATFGAVRALIEWVAK